MVKKRERLGRVQLEVLQFISDHHPVPVSEVAKHFAGSGGKARTTILTVMEKLREKGYVTRKKTLGTYHYSPRHSKRDLMVSVVERFVEESLGGSISPFIAYLAESGRLSKSELATLRRLASDMETRGAEEQ